MNSIYDSHDPHTKANYNSKALYIVVQTHFADKWIGRKGEDWNQKKSINL